MEEIKKINKGLILIIVLLILVILSLIGYIIYENIETDKTKQNSNNITTSIIDDDIDYNNSYEISIEELLELTGKTFSENFENVKLNFKDVSYTLSCTRFSNEYNYCNKYDIIINNQIYYETSGETNVTIYGYKDFIILEESHEMAGTINIYNQTDNEKCFEDNIVYRYVKDKQGYKASLNIKNGIINYASNKDKKILFKEVDISNNFKENIINEFNAEIGIY